MFSFGFRLFWMGVGQTSKDCQHNNALDLHGTRTRTNRCKALRIEFERPKRYVSRIMKKRNCRSRHHFIEWPRTYFHNLQANTVGIVNDADNFPGRFLANATPITKQGILSLISLHFCRCSADVSLDETRMNIKLNNNEGFFIVKTKL